MKDNKLNNAKVIAYCRAAEATADEANLSIDLQKQQVVQAAKELNVEIVKWFEQVDINQPIVTEILNYCKANPDIEFMLVVRPDRVLRSLDQYAYWYRALARIGVSIKSVNCICDDLATESLNEAIGLAIAQFYHDSLSERVREGLRRKKQSLQKAR